MRVGKKTWWAWVFHHAEDACFVIHPNRSRAVVEQFLGEHRPDGVSDRLAAQMNWAKKDHQVCLAHLIRDVQYAIDAGDSAFAPGLRKLLRRACKIGGGAINSPPPRCEPMATSSKQNLMCYCA